jgi:hypothetical protein
MSIRQAWKGIAVVAMLLAWGVSQADDQKKVDADVLTVTVKDMT